MSDIADIIQKLINKLNIKANKTETYSKDDVNAKLDDKADKGTTLADYDINDAFIDNSKITLGDNSIEIYNQIQIDTQLNKKADKTEVKTELDNKADKATTLAGYNIGDAKIDNSKITLGNNSIEVYSKTEVKTELDNKANKADIYTQDQIDKKFTSLSGTVDNKLQAINKEITNLQTKINNLGKLNDLLSAATQGEVGYIKVQDGSFEIVKAEQCNASGEN